MNSTTCETVDLALLESRGVIEVYESARRSDTGLTAKDVYGRWKVLHQLGRVANSPYAMVQERVRGSSDYPWKVVVLSALMNRTHARQVRPIIKSLFLTFPTPLSMYRSSDELEGLIKPLGFANQRAKRLRKFSGDYYFGVRAEDCEGVGEFGRDALKAFVDGRTDFRPDDGFLAKYVEWRRTGKTEWGD